MWIPLSTFATLCAILDVTDATMNKNELHEIFRQRSLSEWTDVWHKEKFSRCRESLVQHLYWACEKDIYRLNRRSQQNCENDSLEKGTYDLLFPLITPKRAHEMIRSRRGGSSITAECCNPSGCTWEEYAEYCPTNKRHTVFVN